VLEVLQGVDLPSVYFLAAYLGLKWKVPTHLYNQVFYHLHHKVSILSRKNLIANHKKLDFLDGHRVEEHPNKLKEQNYSWFYCWAGCGINIPVATSGEGSRDEVDGIDVHFLVVTLIHSSLAHPRFGILLLLAEYNLGAGEKMEVNQCLQSELEDLKVLFHLLNLEDCLLLAVVF